MNNTVSMCDAAINSMGDLAWIARTALDVSRSDANLAHALRNVTCAGIRRAIARIPADGQIKIPVRRDEVIALLARCVAQLRAEGFVACAAVAA